MKSNFQAQLQTSRCTEASAPPSEGGSAADKNSAGVIAQRHDSPEVLVGPDHGEENADSALVNLELKLGDFIARIPPQLLKPGELDVNRPLWFDIGGIAERITRGISTIPLARLLEALPEIFVDDAIYQRDLEIRFPWQRILALIKISETSDEGNGGETLAQKLKRHLKADKQGRHANAREAPTATERDEALQAKIRAGRDEEKGWHSPKEAANGHATNGSAASDRDKANGIAVDPIPEEQIHRLAPPITSAGGHDAGTLEVPESAPALVELPESHPANQREDQSQIAFLEAQLNALSAKHFSEVSILRAETERLVAKVRVETTKTGRDLTASFHIERKRLAEEKEKELSCLRQEHEQKLREHGAQKESEMAQLLDERNAAGAEMEAMHAEFERKARDLTAGHVTTVAALHAEKQPAVEALAAYKQDAAKAFNELKTESERQVAALQAAADYKACKMEAEFKRERTLLLEEKDRALAAKDAEHRAALAARHAGYSEARAGGERERAESTKEREAALAQWNAERESLLREKAALASANELAARLEIELFALRIESAQIVAEVNDRADARVAELESQLAQARARWQDEREEALKNLQEMNRVVAQAAARNAALEAQTRRAEQLEVEIAHYRERIKTVLAERGVLARKLEEERDGHAGERVQVINK